MKLDPYFTPYTKKIISKWVKDLDVRTETVTSLEENTGGKLHGIGLDKDFMDITPKAKATKAKIDLSDYIRQKASTQQTWQSTEWKGNQRMVENICKPYIW